MSNKKWLILLLMLTSVCAQEQNVGIFWPWGNNALGFLFWLIFWIALIIVVYLMIKSTKLFETKESPLEILKKRYAAGKISSREFQKRKKELEGTSVVIRPCR